MIYLIGQLSIWLLLTALFAALAGWAYAAERAAPGEQSTRREKENLLRDLVRLGEGHVGGEITHDDEPAKRLLEIRDGRISELEQALESARARADEAASQLAATQRRIMSEEDAEELSRLRALAAERDREIEVEAAPVEDDAAALQAWRLRYFEQRVKYLEGRAAAPETLAHPAISNMNEPPLMEWRAREASARAAFLEDEVRALSAPVQAAPSREVEAFAANSNVDALLRWRMLYLERRVAHLQNEAAARAEQPAPVAEALAGPDPDMWKWRARYLESRVRHLESVRAARPQMLAAEQEEAAPAPAQTQRRRAKPPTLAAARDGAPDDFTLIEGVSSLQQTTLYSLGVFHFDQVAAWTPENVAWVDQYLRLGGRIEEEEWVEQAGALAREGVSASRRHLVDEDV
ncbi:MAG: hypothetical protein R3C25_09910 [Hyphomonadaceae bacterium]